MHEDIDRSILDSTKLNRFAEKLPNKHTNDLITQEEHSLIKKLVEEGGDIGNMVDFLFCPICNFHTSEYESIHNRWG